MAENRICSVTNCNKKHYGKGLCFTHWQRLRLYGDIFHERRTPARDFFDSLMERNETACIYWPFARTTNGYGHINIDGRLRQVHRLLCEAINGPPPSDIHQAAHECGNGKQGCVNPIHVFWKTPKENTADQVAHGTRLKGTMKPEAKLTEQTVREIREMAAQGFSQAKLASKYGVSRWAIYNTIKRKRWTWVE